MIKEKIMTSKTVDAKTFGAPDAMAAGHGQSPAQGAPSPVTFPCFLDVEASSLEPGGVPIELGWSDSTGAIHSLCLRPDAVNASFHWSEGAEDLHGLSQAFLQQTGVAPAEVAKALNTSLQGALVYSDGIHFDKEWLAQLFKAARLAPTFKLVDAWPLFEERVLAAYEEAGLPTSKKRVTLTYDVETHVETQREAFEGVHRAGPDVAFLLQVYREIGKDQVHAARSSKRLRHGA